MIELSLRWMILKWLRINDKVSDVEKRPAHVLDLIANASETRKLAEYHQELKNFESISKALQGSPASCQLPGQYPAPS